LIISFESRISFFYVSIKTLIEIIYIMGINASKIDFKDPNVTYDTKGTDDPDGVGRIIIFREQGYYTGYPTQPVTGLDARTRGEKGATRAVQLYSKANFKGEVFEVDYGNYPSDVFIPTVIPSNVFSLTIPPRTTIKLFSGDEYDFGGKGGVSLTNAGPDIMRVDSLPTNVRGQIRSVSVISHAIDKTGRVQDPDADDETSEAVITTEKGEVIAAGMTVQNNAGTDRGEINFSHDPNEVEPFQNVRKIALFPEMVVVFYLILLVVVVYLMSETKFRS
jgi:hypothetical protein